MLQILIIRIYLLHTAAISQDIDLWKVKISSLKDSYLKQKPCLRRRKGGEGGGGEESTSHCSLTLWSYKNYMVLCTSLWEISVIAGLQCPGFNFSFSFTSQKTSAG